MMEQYCIFLMMLAVWAVSCQGQHELQTNQLHSRVRELEITVEKLLQKLVDMQNSQIGTSSGQTKRGHVSVGDGFVLNGLNSGGVGFHVTLTDDARLGKGNKIPYDTVIENIGMAFNTGTSEFICRTPGTYLFSLNMACKQGNYVEVSVEISDGKGSPRYILNTVCDHRQRTLPGIDGGFYCGNTQNGGTAIVSMNPGDKASVKMIWPLVDANIQGQGFTTFTGYLLNAS